MRLLECSGSAAVRARENRRWPWRSRGGSICGSTRLTPMGTRTFGADAAPGDYPLTRGLSVMSPEQRQAGMPAALAERFAAECPERLAMVLDDLRALGDGPTIIVEGPQLLPDLVAPLLETPERGLWLLPVPDFARRSVARRFAEVPEALERRYARDVLFTELNREQAASRGLAVLDVTESVPLESSVADMTRRIAALPGLRRAADGRERRRIRMCGEHRSRPAGDRLVGRRDRPRPDAGRAGRPVRLRMRDAWLCGGGRGVRHGVLAAARARRGHGALTMAS
jgi:hypothetical protein